MRRKHTRKSELRRRRHSREKRLKLRNKDARLHAKKK